MTLSQRLKKIKEDWVVIVISLLAAIFLYVFYQISDLDTKPIMVDSTKINDTNIMDYQNLENNIDSNFNNVSIEHNYILEENLETNTPIISTVD